MKKKNDLFNLKLEATQGMIIEVKYKKGQREFFKKIAKLNGIPLDFLIEKKICSAIKSNFYSILKLKCENKREFWLVRNMPPQ